MVVVQQDEGSFEPCIRRTGPQLIGMFPQTGPFMLPLPLHSSTVDLFPRASGFPPMTPDISQTQNLPKASYPRDVITPSMWTLQSPHPEIPDPLPAHLSYFHHCPKG